MCGIASETQWAAKKRGVHEFLAEWRVSVSLTLKIEDGNVSAEFVNIVLLTTPAWLGGNLAPNDAATTRVLYLLRGVLVRGRLHVRCPNLG